MSALHIRLSQPALAAPVLRLGVAAYGRGEKNASSAANTLAADQAATRVMHSQLDDVGKEVSQLAAAASAGERRSSYLIVLTWCFMFFNTARVLAYLPTVMTIVQHGDSTQHSLWTWLTWMGANVTMAAWLFEHNGARMNRAIAVSVANAAMCLATSSVIVAVRL
jgi:hypothetical protein